MTATVLLTAFGTHGDVGPVATLANALQVAGLRVVVLGNPCDAALFTAAGAGFRPVGPPLDFARILGGHPSYMGLRGGELVVRDFFARLAPAYHLAALRVIAAERPRVVVAHFGCFGAAWAARRVGLPLVTLHLAPMTWLDAHDSAHGPPHCEPVVRHLLLPLVDRRLSGLLAPAARSVGVPADGRLFSRSILAGDLLLGLWAHAFRPARNSDPERAVVCGSVAPPDAASALPPALERFLAAGPPPVVVGLGSSAVHTAGALWDRTAAACRRLGRRCVLVCGGYRPRAPGIDLCHVPHAAFAGLFPHCEAVVHHGGIGTTLAALAAGRPQLVLSFAHDQFDNGARVHHLGLGETCWQGAATPGRLTRLLARVLAAGPAARAVELGGQARGEEDGAGVAARRIHGLVRAASAGR